MFRYRRSTILRLERALGTLEQQTIDETRVNTSNCNGDLRAGATLVPHDGSDSNLVNEQPHAERLSWWRRS